MELTTSMNSRTTFYVTCACLLGTLATVALAQTPVPNAYVVHNLVSDLPGIADKQDANLVNPWGNAYGPGPFWIANNGTGTSTLYDGTGTATPLIVKIPSASSAAGGPVTGVIFNSFNASTNVLNVAAGKTALFLFCSEDGVISGWNNGVDATNAKILVNSSASGAVYKGCALGGTAAAPLFFAANFNSGKVDVFDGKFMPVNLAGAFKNPLIPAGFAPFNVQVIQGRVVVTYARQNAARHDDVAGAGSGFVATYDQNGNLMSNLVAQGALNSPWGIALAPSTFGAFGGDLLVGNFGDGRINAFDPNTGALLGTLQDTQGNPIKIPGLWSLIFGNGTRDKDVGTLYFAAGIGGGPENGPLETHGLFGSIQAPAAFQTSNVVNTASFLAGAIAPNTWITITGNGLSAMQGPWKVTSSELPTQLNNVTVTVNGEAAPISYTSNTQINFLVPADIQPGTPAKIQITNNGLPSAVILVPVNALAPAFFIIGTGSNGNNYIAATHADGTLIGPTAVFKTATPAKPGETIVLYATGLGITSPGIPNGQTITTPLALPVLPTVVIDGMPVKVEYAGLTGTGVYQLNVTIPMGGMTNSDVLVVALLGNGDTQSNAYLTISQ